MSATPPPPLRYSYGGPPRRYTMRLSEQYRRATGTLLLRGKPWGSFFVVTDQWPSRSTGKDSIVTARHVIEDCASLTAVMDGLEPWVVHRHEWETLSDDHADVAVMAFPDGATPAGTIPIGIDADNIAEARKVELGQTVFFGGAWNERPDPIVPIIRSATVAAIDQPDLVWGEPTDPERWRVDGHLIDTRVVNAGMSGGPCFVQFYVANLAREDDKDLKWPDETWKWMMRHEHPRAYEDLRSVLTFTHWWGMFVADDACENDRQSVPIGIVVPTRQIRTLLAEKGLLATSDDGVSTGGVRPRSSESIGDEFENFESLTKKLVNTPDPDEKPSD